MPAPTSTGRIQGIETARCSALLDSSCLSTRSGGFATWLFQRNCHLLAYEIDQFGKHPALWEKKGSSLYTARNVSTYPELRKFMNRLFNKIAALNGFVFYVGTEKTAPVGSHDSNWLNRSIRREAIKRLDDFCAKDCNPTNNFVLALDGHDQREALTTEASLNMFGGRQPRCHLVEPPVPTGKSSIPDTAGRRLDCRSGLSPWRILGRPRRISRKRSVLKALPEPASPRQLTKRTPQLMAMRSRLHRNAAGRSKDDNPGRRS